MSNKFTCSSGEISLVLFASLWWREKPMVFSEILTRTTVGLIEKGLLFQGKMLICGRNLLYLEVNGIYKWSQSECMHNSQTLE